jgi:NADPH-dependent 2,4-dienoyl-CoA reductase/sulfur reductase-like enzyme
VKCDVVVLGAGPAGVEAALTCAAHDLAVVLLDSAPAAGGQVYRAPAPELEQNGSHAPDAHHQPGDRLRERLRNSRVLAIWEQTIWLVEPGYTVETVGTAGRRTFHADALIVATGTHERIVPVPGWTLPGVFGLGAVTLLLKSQQVLPGARTVVAGCGPLLLAAAAGILRAGGEVAAVVDLNGWSDMLRLGPRMTARPDLVREGLQWMKLLRQHRVPTLRRHAVVAIEGDSTVREATIAPHVSPETSHAHV